MKREITIPAITLIVENPGETSDGYHTFNELYDHRCLLFIGLILSNPNLKSWRSRNDEEGERIGDYFIAGLECPSGQITYHVPLKFWNLLNNTHVETLDFAEWDGHTAKDVISRLWEWFLRSNITPQNIVAPELRSAPTDN